MRCSIACLVRTDRSLNYPGTGRCCVIILVRFLLGNGISRSVRQSLDRYALAALQGDFRFTICEAYALYSFKPFRGIASACSSYIHCEVERLRTICGVPDQSLADLQVSRLLIIDKVDRVADGHCRLGASASGHYRVLADLCSGCSGL